jgi:hypothetical protein
LNYNNQFIDLEIVHFFAVFLIFVVICVLVHHECTTVHFVLLIRAQFQEVTWDALA